MTIRGVAARPERNCRTAPSPDGNPQRNRPTPARARMRTSCVIHEGPGVVKGRGVEG
jgi:hypothetical protein